MKKFLLLICSVITILPARADEGMWLPWLIGKNYDDMVRLGLKLSEDDLYNINHSSLKDAVVLFGGGCTAEMISGNGLLLTNHHCGYDAIASLSTVDKNYLDNGYFAKNMKEELPAKGIAVLFLQNVYDVTGQVMQALGNATGDEYNKRLREISQKIEDSAEKSGKYVATVKDFFNGNQFLLLTYKRYSDVRFVGAPPKSLGKFGGETDNWMWPRHTCDFSMFRVYANKDNEPAAYSADNIPYKPKKYLPVSINGEQEGDYAMIFGYPARTNRYEVSYGVDLAVNVVNPSIVSIRDKRLAIYHEHMEKDKTTYLKLTSTYASIANYWKYYIGQTEQLKRLNVIEKKKKQEDKYIKWAASNGFDASLMDKYAKLYEDYTPYAKHIVYYGECFLASEIARVGAATEPLYKYLTKKENNADSIKKYITFLKATRRSIMKEFDEPTEREMLADMSKMFYNEVPKVQQPEIYQNVIFAKFGKYNDDNTYTKYADYVCNNTFVIDSNKFNAFCDAPTVEKLDKDPATEYALSFVHNYTKNYRAKYTTYLTGKKELSSQYLKGLMKMKEDKLFYPDANQTMRITYGSVLGYDPKDGVHYNYYTTIDGMVAKYKPGDEEFDLPKEILTLQKNKDYGRYADEDGTLHTCFMTNNDITGGNSGSPVMNARGELIGAAFDGNWEAMSGDIAFDKKYKRTIVCDIRFILFVIDKLGHAKNLVDEMDIRD